MYYSGINFRTTVNNVFTSIVFLVCRLSEHFLFFFAQITVWFWIAKKYQRLCLLVRIDDKVLWVLKLNNVSLSLSDLGLILDHELRFKKNTKKLIRKAYASLEILFSSRHLLNTDLKKLLCDALVLLLRFNYCDTIYSIGLLQIDAQRIREFKALL